jgi:chromosomal replication initiation ATPase DnaA
MYLCQKYARMKLKDIGAYFGAGESSVCQAARRVTARMTTDRRLKKNRRDGKTVASMNNEDLTP